MNSSAMSPVLNPDTPLTFISPELADVLQISAYTYFTCAGILTWDWLMSMPDEYRILSTGRISFPKIVYICARVFTLAFCLCSAVFVVAPIRNCQAMIIAISALAILALNVNNILFFLRVRAVYGDSRSATAFFGFCYVAVFGSSLVMPFAVPAAHIGTTAMCIHTDVKSWETVTMLCDAVYDTLIFLAISYRISSQFMGGQGWRPALRCFFRGDGAPRVGKDLLHNGQLCYLVTIVASITQIIVTFRTNYKTTTAIPVLALENVMGCRVHRAVILGLIDSDHRRSNSTNASFMLTTCISGDISFMKAHVLDASTGLEPQAGRISKESVADRV